MPCPHVTGRPHSVHGTPRALIGTPPRVGGSRCFPEVELVEKLRTSGQLVIHGVTAVSYTHLTLPTTPYV